MPAKKPNNTTNVTLDGLDELYADWYKCSECQNTNILAGFHYCPDCGRKITKIDGVEKMPECPECGADLEWNSDEEFYECEECGEQFTKAEIEKDREEKQP